MDCLISFHVNILIHIFKNKNRLNYFVFRSRHGILIFKCAFRFKHLNMQMKTNEALKLSIFHPHTPSHQPPKTNNLLNHITFREILTWTITIGHSSVTVTNKYGPNIGALPLEKNTLNNIMWIRIGSPRSKLLEIYQKSK